jgi:hypothetical protein
MVEKIGARKNVISTEFLSPTYRISGEVIIRDMPIVDLLNDKNANFIRAENLYVSPVADPVVFRVQHTGGMVRKDQISLVMLQREEEGYARHTLYRNMGLVPLNFSLFAIMPGFEVRGGIKVNSSSEVDSMLLQSIDRFITIYQATVTLTVSPDIQYTGAAVLINREHAQLFFVDKAADRADKA